MDKILAYLNGGIALFAVDPPDSDYQRGYLAAVKDVRDYVKEQGKLADVPNPDQLTLGV